MAHLAPVVIMNGMTVSLDGQNNNIIVMDSHLHGQLQSWPKIYGTEHEMV